MRMLVPGERAAIANELSVEPPLALAVIGLDRDRRLLRDFTPIDTLRRELRTANLRFPIELVDRSDAVLVLLELYCHAGSWRACANGQGFVHGLAALADAFGGERAWTEPLIRSGPSGRPREEGADRDDVEELRAARSSPFGVACAC